MNYLLFRLYGPLASWGELAIGESRHTALKPKKSALLGLLAASLGIAREDESGQKALSEGYRFAFRMRSIGQLLLDYHTVQSPDSSGKLIYRTRRDELVTGKARLGTLLSTREYRTGAQAIVAIRELATAPWSLTELKNALSQPVFHQYLGRKSCPLAAPLQAEVISADNFYRALIDYQPKPLLPNLNAWDSDVRWLPDDAIQGFYWEGDIADFSEANSIFDPAQVQQFSQYDQPLSRLRWQFDRRAEYFWQVKVGGVN